MSAPLPPPPAAGELTLSWFIDQRATVAAYFAAIYALQNLQVVVIKDGVRLPPVSIKAGGVNAVIEIIV